MQIEKKDRIIQLFIEVRQDAVYQNVLIISKKHDDLFEFLAKKNDEIDWENYELPESKISGGEN